MPPRKIDISDPDSVEAIKQRQIRRRARMFAEVAIENLLATHNGNGAEVERILLQMIDQMKG